MYEFALPDLGEGVAEGEILEWHVAPGDAVSEDDVLLEVETDKAAVEVPSPVDGTVEKVRGDPGDVVETGSTIVTIDTGDGGTAAGDDADADADMDADADERKSDAQAADSGDGEDGAEAGAATASEPSDDGQRVFAPPSVRRLARERGVDVASVSGTGPSGRITEDDVRSAAQEGGEERDESSEGGEGSESGETDGDDGPAETTTNVKSAVRRVDGSEGEPEDDSVESEPDDGPTSVVRSVDESTTAGSASTPVPEADTDAETDVETDAEPAVKSAVSSTASTAERDRTLATPATRRVARELGVDVDAVPTDVTRDGEPFVDEAAVRSYAEHLEGEAVTGAGTSTDTDAAVDAAPAGGVDAGQTPGADANARETDARLDAADRDVSVARTEEYRGIRRRIGERMAKSRREVPHATHHDRVEVSELVAARERLEPLAEDRGVRLTYTPFVLKCVGAALKDHPVLNTRIDTDAGEIYYLDDYNVGVATDTDRGLLVPVVDDVDERGIMDLAAATNDHVERARDGSIDRAEMQGGTFTVTNVGAIGGEYADPVINVPQTAVLAVGSLRERPVAVDGSVEARPTLPLSLAIDHRVIDGADAARFTNTLKTYLADPTRLLLE